MLRMVLCFSILAAVASLASIASADEPPKPTRHPITRADALTTGERPASSSSIYLVGTAAVLAVFGVIGLIAKKGRPLADSSGLKVMSRTSLSPKHAVYLLKVGDRTLIIGTGAQGPPSLLGEIPLSEPAISAPRLAPLATKAPGAA